jgi:ornithine decarboxylase
MEDVLRAGASPRDIIYAHPTKPPADIRVATTLGVPTTVVDSEEEIAKLAENSWRGSVLIRLLVPDAGSAQPFSSKFGAPLSWVPSLLSELRSAKLPHVGWSFHVGSVCGNPDQYRTAIRLCADADYIAGRRADIVDIGGGFVAEEEPFAAAAAVIRREQACWAHKDTQWIAEPGRFLSAPVCELEVEVIGVKPRVDRTGLRVTVDETIYGTFSNIPFDGQQPTYELIAPDAATRPRVRTTLVGRTCDSADCLARDIEMPALRVGDRLRVSNMGAYTIVSASEFNGFPCPRRVYVE